MAVLATAVAGRGRSTRIGLALRRALLWVHRWLGVATCLLFAMWFASGIVMLYVPFPSLSDAERLRGLAPLEAGAVRVGPAEALRIAGVPEGARELRLTASQGRPAWQVTAWDDRRLVVHADDGSTRDAVDSAAALAEALAFARRAAGAESAGPDAGVETLERDQWTVPNGLNPLRPFHRVRLDDAAGTELYVSAVTGEVVRDTARAERFWNWLGSVPHWIYFTEIRRDPALWRTVVVWLSGVGVVGAAAGAVVGIVRLRRRDGRGLPGSPHRGWMAWHHWTGLAGGVLILGWIVSGWLSMNPNRWFSPRMPSADALQRYAGDAASALRAVDAAALRARLAGEAVVEIEWRVTAGVATAWLRRADGSRTAWRPGEAAAFDDATLVAAARRAMPQAGTPTIRRLDAHDHYYYGRDGRAVRPLPVLRLAFDDDAATWWHVDPVDGRVIDRSDRSRRVHRWLFHALHSGDVAPLRDARPWWDAVMIGGSLIGGVASVAGVVVGWRVLRRTSRRSRAAGPVSG